MTLSKLIEQLESATQNKSGMFELGEDTMCAVMALALRERAEPVMYAMASGDDFDTEAVSTRKEVVDAWVDEWNEAESRSEPRYRTASLYAEQLATVVPDELLTAMEEVLRISDRQHDAWDKAKAAVSACRAAMLQEISNEQ